MQMNMSELIINPRKNNFMKGLILLIVIFFLLPERGLSQDNLERRAKLLAASDYFEFRLDEHKNVDTVGFETVYLESKGMVGVDFIRIKFRDLKKMKFYFDTNFLNKNQNSYFRFSSELYEKDFTKKHDLSFINNIPFYEEEIGLDKFILNEVPYQCDFIIAYVKNEDRFFKLKGFRYNEFAEFFHRYLKAGNTYLTPSVYYEVNMEKKRKQNKTLLRFLYVEELDFKYLYQNFVKKKGIQDFKSCYRRDWLIYNYTTPAAPLSTTKKSDK